MSMIGVYQKMCQERVNALLKDLFTPHLTEVERLYKAMHYSVMIGGKRIRPLLVYGACEALGGELVRADAAACAVELIHAYSLIHDDLPAMDDDELRRGQPTTHKAFDEATAILAGDSLQTMAFELLSDFELNPVSPTDAIKMVSILARAAGAKGMVGGQVIDLNAVGQTLTQNQLETMHLHKTGALIEASVMLGALASGHATENAFIALQNYARVIGLAFQIQDDVLDVESDTKTLGKQQGSDIAHNKPTYPSIMGLDEAKKRAKMLHKEAIDYLKDFSKSADVLRDLATYIVERSY